MKCNNNISTLFIGTDRFSIKAFQQILKDPDFTIKAVMTPPPLSKKDKLAPLAIEAKKKSIPILMPKNLKENRFLSQVKKFNPKCAILLSYGKILPERFLQIFPQKAFNFHASLLPRWRGAAPIQRAIMAGDQTLGMSLQIMTTGLDTGPLIGTCAFPFTEEMDARDFFQRMDILIKNLLSPLKNYLNGQLQSIPQQSTQATYAHKIDKKESIIQWEKPAISILNQIRALTLGPQSYTIHKRKRLKVYKAKWSKRHITSSKPTGQIIEICKDSFKVTCQKSVLSILEVQPESKKIMSASEYIRGYPIQIGDQLG